jgi:hypothetical protein
MILVAVLTLLLPGLFLSSLMRYPQRDPLCWLATLLCTALGTWITLFWLIRLIPLSLAQLVVLVAAASLVGVTVRRRKILDLFVKQLEWRGPHALALMLLGGVLLVRFVPLLLTAVAPGADMSMHSYIARLIIDTNGIPASYRPLLPVDDFGTYAVGFSAVSALLASLGGLGAAQACFGVACAVHALLTLVVYGYCRQYTGSRNALLAALLVTFVVKDPQRHFHWGGNPTVLALALVGQGLVFLRAILDGEQRWRCAVVGGALCFAAAALTHSVLPYALVYYGAGLVLLRLYHAPAPARVPMFARVVLIAAVTVVLAAPYLLQFNLDLTQAEVDWIRAWQRRPSHAPVGPGWLLPLTSVLQIGRRLGFVFLAILLAATAWVLMKDRRGMVGPVLGVAIILLLVVNAELWILPASYALYPDRIMLLMIFPGSQIIIRAFESHNRLPLASGPAHRLGIPVLIGIGAVFHFWHFYLNGYRWVSVTENDLQVVAWIEQNVPAGAVIENNYGDAGIWVPALAGRAVLRPHVNVIYLDDIKPWQDRTQPRFTFVGERRVYTDGPYGPDRDVDLTGTAERFRRGGAVVYERAPQ